MGKVYVVGIGPGAKDQMTVRAAKVLSECQVIVGYTVYIDLIKEEYPDKICLSTPMRQEVQRCRMALEEAGKEQNVAVVCSGDAGIYGMAGLVYELAADYSGVEIEVVPGITAASGGAAILGAPLMHDFAVISLSDLMTPWEKIEKRLRMAAMADFVICIYNPSSRKRADYLKKACLCMMEYKKEDTVCGIVKNIGREGECMKILSLKELSETDVDMFTTVFVGNEETRIIGDKMVTPRGYKNV
ncbi:precorrin-3B C(17)-methyltransferase [bacterium]|uniref:precorrin-3B C(17)-methyltransferase n=1 Tax=Lachnospiraceae TaxID=186803 RepID=UPI002A29FFBF|nr:precorrin-3B C(17)-methyltransferase [bacterium]MDY2886992.1 precorrin-3B C(17)-methyltransferase [Bariatricus sp.]MCI7148773.1 precorrin-3B C(17)-methyltransferase [bacterium]MDD6514702.1 precorrin-3B C(17)-methyltransferase [bacterium]MDY4193393.1 precorrin-3B C(17)-methyltransferase [Bariatricus sp.]